jgi:hypothetical protein
MDEMPESTAAPASSTKSISGAKLLQFQRFAEQAEGLHLRKQSSTFAEFAPRARRMVIEFLRHRLEENRSELEALCRWTVEDRSDILWQAGLRGNERHCTNLVGWMLSPPGETELALKCQRAWLQALKLGPEVRSIRRAATPSFEDHTEDGRPDLTFHYPDAKFLVVVEAKVGSEEHATPSGLAQTSAYLASVRKRLDLGPSYLGAMIFLTRDGRQGLNPEAIPSTYEGLVVALYPVLGAAKLSDDLRWAYKVAITHLLRVTSREGEKPSELSLLKTALESDRPSDDSVLQLATLLRALLARRLL